MPLVITILAIIGAITVFGLFCVTALFVAIQVMYNWPGKPYQEQLSRTKQRSKRKTRK